MSRSAEKAKRDIYFISKWYFFSKCYPGHPDFFLGKLTENVSPTIRNVFAQNLKTKKLLFFSPVKSFIKAFPWTRGMHFWHPSQNLPTKCPNFLMKMRKICFSSKCSRGHPYCTSGDVKRILDKPARNLYRQYERFSIKVWKRWKVTFSYSSKEFLKTFPGTRRNHFWKPCRSVFFQRPKFFSVNVRKWFKKFFFKLFFSSVRSSGHLKCRLYEPAETFCQNPVFC